MAKVFTIPVAPQMGRRRRESNPDPRYVDGQRVLVEAMRYLAQSDPVNNRDAVGLLSERPHPLPHDRLASHLIPRTALPVLSVPSLKVHPYPAASTLW